MNAMSETAQTPKRANRSRKRMPLFGAVIIAACWILVAAFLFGRLDQSVTVDTAANSAINLTENFDKKVMNQLGSALDGLVPIHREYSLSDQDMVAPKPNPDHYGTAEDPAQLAVILEKAAQLLDGQTTLFTMDTEIKEGSQIHYYLDETIFAVTWKQVVDGGVYTFSEVKIAHASQFRRFLADGKYGSSALYTTQEMAKSVNAVVASSGDYYGYRGIGICVNQGQVYRERGHLLDTCFIDENGDLLFSYAGEITDKETAQRYVDENQVRFSLCFGPVMIRDGKTCVPGYYNSGEINDMYARAALCQMGPLHYVVVTANMEESYYAVPTVEQFARNLEKMGVPTAYALDGGQTAAIVMDNQLINTVSYGSQREISDIIYFATAIPEDEWE